MALTLENLSGTAAGRTGPDGVSLTLEPGLPVTLLGRRQSGKTMLLQMIAGLARPDDGLISLHRHELNLRPPGRRSVALVPARYLAYVHSNCADDLAAPLKAAGLSKQVIHRRIRREAQRCGISELLDKPPACLDHQQQRRLALARALARETDILLLDEPLADLPPAAHEHLRRDLPQILDKRNCVILLATRHPQVALTLGGRIAVIGNGRLLQHDDALTVYRRPANVAAAQICSVVPMNLMAAELRQTGILLADNPPFTLPPHLAETAPGHYLAGIRPSQLRLLANRPQDEEHLSLPVCINSARFNGAETLVHADCEGHDWLLSLPGIHALESGEHAHMAINAGQIFLFDANSHALVASPAQRFRRPGAERDLPS